MDELKNTVPDAQNENITVVPGVQFNTGILNVIKTNFQPLVIFALAFGLVYFMLKFQASEDSRIKDKDEALTFWREAYKNSNEALIESEKSKNR